MARLDDETILAALLTAGSARKAAQVAGCSPETIRKRLNKPEFAEKYIAAKRGILQEAFTSISNSLSAAADVLCSSMQSEENPATVRVSAADALLRHGLRYLEAAEILPRLEALEKQQGES